MFEDIVNSDLKILLIEDNIDDAVMIRHYFSKVNSVKLIPEVTHVTSLSKALTALGNAQFDIILMDLHLPDAAEIPLFRSVKQMAVDIPIIIVTVVQDVDLPKKLMEEGAQDYLIKDLINTDLLQRTLWYAISRNRIEAARKKTDERYRSLFDNSRDAIFIVDQFSRLIVDANPEAERLTGLPQDVLFGMDHATLFSLDEIESLFHHDNINNQNLPVTYLQHFDETLIPVDAKVAHFELDGAPAVLVVLRDITQRIHYEQELAEAMKLAEAGNRAKSAFLAAISHDIRTPMNAVIGLTDILLKTPLNEQQKDYTQIIKSSGSALLTLINDILDFSKIEAGAMSLVEENFNLSNHIEDVIKTLNIQIKDKSVTLESNYTLDLIQFVKGDPHRLRQILINLVGNAIKFTESGTIKIKTSQVSTSNKDKLLIKFEVIDTGIGISENAQKNLFQAFTQADKTTAVKYGGTGLGLAICKQLSELMGGTIQIESQPGKGSNFWFTALFFPGEEIQNDALVLEDEAQNNVFENMMILVAEDERANCIVIDAMLKSLGYHYHVVNNGLQAFDYFKSHSPDLILMDCQMPEMDGYTATQNIRNYEASENRINQVPIVAITAHAIDEEKDRCIEAGMNGFLTKPINVEHLNQEIRRWQAKIDPGIRAENPERDHAVQKQNQSDELISINHLQIEELKKHMDADMIHELIDVVITDFPKGLAEMNVLLKNQDIAALYRVAHRVKSVPGNLGAVKLASLCQQLNDFCKAEDEIQKIDHMVRQIEAEWLQVEQYLKQCLITI